MKLSLLVVMLLDIDYRKSGRRKGPGLAKHKNPKDRRQDMEHPPIPPGVDSDDYYDDSPPLPNRG